MNKTLEIYKKYYIDRDYEQVDLYRLLYNEFQIRNAIYPGSYVHISPSFIFPEVVYIDTDNSAKKFFKCSNVVDYINKRKEYATQSTIIFFGIDYTEIISRYVNYFQLMISQYSGFISENCKDYLKQGGLLLVNNSHGDAGLAALDDDYTLIATIHKNNRKYRISYNSLQEYFIPKEEMNVTKEYLKQIKKGVGYQKTAPLYIFQKKKAHNGMLDGTLTRPSISHLDGKY